MSTLAACVHLHFFTHPYALPNSRWSPSTQCLYSPHPDSIFSIHLFPFPPFYQSRSPPLSSHPCPHLNTLLTPARSHHSSALTLTLPVIDHRSGHLCSLTHCAQLCTHLYTRLCAQLYVRTHLRTVLTSVLYSPLSTSDSPLLTCIFTWSLRSPLYSPPLSVFTDAFTTALLCAHPAYMGKTIRGVWSGHLARSLASLHTHPE